MRQFTEAEFKEIAKAEDGLRHVGFDVDHEGANHNANLVLQYFQANPTVPVTVANIYEYIEKNRDQFIWRTQAQMEYDKLERENPGAATQLATWLATQGRVGQLVNTGDQALQNASLLLVELRGRDVNPTTIFQAIGRLSCRVGRNLHFVPKPSKEVPHDYKPGQFVTDYNVTPGEHQRRLRASRTQPQENHATRSTREQAAAKHEAEKLRSGYSHAEDEQVSKLFVTDPQTREIDWVATKKARLAMLQRFANRRSTRFLVS
jgi:hypothetical protein